MPTPRMKTLLRLAMAAGATCSLTLIANAREIPFQTPAQLKSTCIAAGGDYIAPGKRGVYGCQHKGGNVVSCGGVGKHAKTCSNPARTGGKGATTTKGGGPVVRDHRRPRPTTTSSDGSNTGGKPIVKTNKNWSAPTAGGTFNARPSAGVYNVNNANGRSGGRRR